MGAAKQEYDVCAVEECHRVPFAVWPIRLTFAGRVATVNLPLCEADSRAYAVTDSVGDVTVVRWSAS